MSQRFNTVQYTDPRKKIRTAALCDLYAFKRSFKDHACMSETNFFQKMKGLFFCSLFNALSDKLWFIKKFHQ